MYFAPNGSAQWQSVTEELRSAEMPLRKWFSAMLPHTKRCFVDFRKTLQHKCIEPPTGVAARTTGAAFDYLLRYRLGTADPAELAVIGAIFAGESRVHPGVVIELAAELLEVSRRWKGGEAARGATPPDKLIRGCWAVALLTELSRGVPFDRSPLAALGCVSRLDALLELMPDGALRDLIELYEVTSNTLLPFLSQRFGDVILGPAFSAALPGDADLIKGRTLVEFKASVDRRKRDGTPRYSLDARTLYQLVAYGLLGYDEFCIEEVVIFNARYAHLYAWPLSGLLVELAGKPATCRGLSAELKLFLDDPCNPIVPAPAREVAKYICDFGELPKSRRRRERFMLQR